MATAPLTKTALRRRMRTALGQLPPEQQHACSLLICERLEPLIRRAETVAVFAPQPSEPDLRILERSGLWNGRTVLFPMIGGTAPAFAPAGRWEDLQPGPFGLLVPVAAASSLRPQLVLVPGLAFTRQGDRLGRGAGFYDRYLSGLDAGVMTVGVAFHLQLVEELPREAHDVRLRCIVTEWETIPAERAGQDA